MANKATSADVILLAPELGAENPARLSAYLSVASAMLKDAEFDDESFPRAHAALTAHLITMGNRGAAGGGGGPVTSVKVGEVSVNYANSSTDDEGLQATPYGTIYLLLRNAYVVTATLSTP
jgi:hypothetical protein